MAGSLVEIETPISGKVLEHFAFIDFSGQNLFRVLTRLDPFATPLARLVSKASWFQPQGFVYEAIFWRYWRVTSLLTSSGLSRGSGAWNTCLS